MSGVASCKWVRPIFTTSAHSRALAQSTFTSASTLGTRWFASSSTTATCIAAGKVSFDDCDMLTWSLGCTGACVPSVPPASWMARLAITSFTFMFDWVPEPVCQT